GLISARGNTSSEGNITATGNITSSGAFSSGAITSTSYLAITATTRRPTTQSTMGFYLGCDNNYWAALELCGVNAAVVVFTTAGTDMKGRFMYTYSTSQFDWFIACCFTSKNDTEVCRHISRSNISINNL
ncbi:MAG: hypothetical protein ACKPKO_24390, partial [Candidatus Fonsibacter sp.]